MNLNELISLSSSEEKSEAYLRAKDVLQAFHSCPFCGSSSIGRVRKKLHKRLLVQIRKDSILEDLQVPFSKFILAIKLFLLEVPVNKAHKELDLAYNTAYTIYNKIREAIYQFVKEDDMLSGETQMDEGSFAGKRIGKRGIGAEGKIPVFGLLEREGESESGGSEGCVGREHSEGDHKKGKKGKHYLHRQV